MYLQDEIFSPDKVSMFQPLKEVGDFTGMVKEEYHKGYNILHREWEELNGYSVIERMNKDQKTFNTFVDESVDDPAEAWKFRGSRSYARNKTIAMHAHLTSQYIIPTIVAQNEEQEEDQDMADVMYDILQWMIDNSSYKSAFLLSTMGALVNPVTYMTAEFAEVFQKVKIRGENGELEKKDILDEELSGFQPQVFSADQVLITNAYEQNIQRQRSLIPRRYIDYSEARAIYGEHPNFGYVQAGHASIYNDEDGLFYDIKDDEHPNLVEEATYKCRRTDTEVVFVGGIYLGDEEVDDNPMRHRSNQGAPRYNITPFGYERINEHFFFYKSLINRVGWDNDLLDAMYEVVMNREILDLMTPVAVSGVDSVDSDIIFPGAVAAFADKDVEVKPILPARNGASGYQAIREVENSLSESSSISDVQQGQLPDASQKAFSVSRAEQNARTLMSGVAKSIGASVALYGQLMVDIALNHLTVPQIDEITNATKYRKFILQDQQVDGKSVSKRILFDEMLIGQMMTEEEREALELELLTEINYPENKEHIYTVNPHLFSKMKYMTRIEPDVMLNKNESFEKAISLELYNTFRQEPLINPEVLVRKVARPFFKGETDKLIVDSKKTMGTQQPQNPNVDRGAGAARNQALAQESGVAALV